MEKPRYFKTKTKFKQYISTNPALKKMPEEKYNTRRVTIPQKAQEIHTIILAKQKEENYTHTHTHTHTTITH